MTDLTKLTRKELVIEAEELGMTIPTSWNKTRIIEEIDEFRTQNGDYDEENEDEMEDDEIEHKFGSAGSRDDEDDYEVPADEEHDEAAETEEETEAVIENFGKEIEEIDFSDEEMTEAEAELELHLIITRPIEVVSLLDDEAMANWPETARTIRVKRLQALKAKTEDDKRLQKKIRAALRKLNHYQYLGAYYRHNPLSSVPAGLK